MYKKGISVIICTYNGAKQLQITCEHLFNQKSLQDIAWEIIIVDNNSTDSTSAIIDSILKSNDSHGIKHLNQSSPGKLAALEMGILNAEYSYLLICDDDNWLDEYYLANAYHFMETDSNIGITGGRGMPVDTNSLPNWIHPHLHNYAAAAQWQETADITHTIGSVYGAGMVIRKEIYDNVFQKKWPLYLSALRNGKNLLSGEDTEICYIARLFGYKIYYNESLRFKHNFPTSKIRKSYLIQLYYFFGLGASALTPYVEIENHLSGKSTIYNILLEIYRLIRYDLFNLLKAPNFHHRKNLHYRYGFIKGLFMNRNNIEELRTYLKTYQTLESSSSHF